MSRHLINFILLSNFSIIYLAFSCRKNITIECPRADRGAVRIHTRADTYRHLTRASQCAARYNIICENIRLRNNFGSKWQPVRQFAAEKNLTQHARDTVFPFYEGRHAPKPSAMRIYDVMCYRAPPLLRQFSLRCAYTM